MSLSINIAKILSCLVQAVPLILNISLLDLRFEWHTHTFAYVIRNFVYDRLVEVRRVNAGAMLATGPDLAKGLRHDVLSWGYRSQLTAPLHVAVFE